MWQLNNLLLSSNGSMKKLKTENTPVLLLKSFTPLLRARLFPRIIQNYGSAKAKKESEKVGLKLNIQKTKIMESGSISSWQIEGEAMQTIRDFILGGLKITADGDCSHEIRRCLLLGREVMPNLDSILKSRGITLPTKVHIVKAMVFPVVMYGCESWTVKKAER